MKSDRLAIILRDLADLIDNLPESELGTVSATLKGLMPKPGGMASNQRRGGDLFSLIDVLPKRELVDLIEGISAPLIFRKKDSQKDVASRIKSLLKKKPDYQRRVRNFLRHGRPTQGSAELERAFRSILRDSDEISTADN